MLFGDRRQIAYTLGVPPDTLHGIVWNHVGGFSDRLAIVASAPLLPFVLVDFCSAAILLVDMVEFVKHC